jgi:Tol biopolymer transport system component
MAAMSLDGRYVAHVSFLDGQQSLWLRQIATTSNVEVVPPANVRYTGLTFSPDGNHLYYATYASGGNVANLYQVPILGGGARLILEDVDTAVTFSPDGREFAFIRGYPDTGRSAVMVANADGSNLRQLYVRSRPLEYPLLGIAWSPDGRRIAVTGHNTEELRGQIAIVDVASKTETILPTPDWREISRIAWLPDGTGLLANAQESAGESSNQVFLVSYPDGGARRLTNDLTSYSDLSVAPDGRSFVAIRNERRSAILTMPMDDPGSAAPISAEASADEGGQGIAWTPDGRLVYTTEAGGNPDIWIMHADGSRRVQLTSNPGLDMSPRVTRDGRYVVYVSDRDGAMRIWRMALDGSGAALLTSDVLARPRVNLSADGLWVYYNETRGDSRKVSIDGGEPVQVLPPAFAAKAGEPLPPGFHEPMPSPDGRWLAGHYSTSNGERIAVFPADGGTVRLLDTVPPSAQWAGDSHGFLYVDTRAGVSNVARRLMTAPSATPVTRFTSERIFAYAVSPDQARLAVVRGRLSSDVVLVSTAEK